MSLYVSVTVLKNSSNDLKKDEWVRINLWQVIKRCISNYNKFYKQKEPITILLSALNLRLLTCRPHVYLEALQPLSPAFFSTSFSAALPALLLVAVQPLSPAFFSTALPALSLSAVHPLDDAQPERLKPPALIRLAIPIPARSFFKSLLSILFLLCMKKWGRANKKCPCIL